MIKSNDRQPEISEHALLEIENHLAQIKSLAFAMIAALEAKLYRSEDDDMSVRDIKASELLEFDENALLKSFAGAFSEEFCAVSGFMNGLKKFPDKS